MNNSPSGKGLLRPHLTAVSLIQKFTDIGIIALTYYFVLVLNSVEWLDRHTSILLAEIIVFYLIAEVKNLYRSWRIQPVINEIVTLYMVWVGSIFVLIGASIVLGAFEYQALENELIWSIVVPLGLVISRLFIRSLLHQLRNQGKNSRTVAIIGMTKVGLELVENLERCTWMGLRFKGFYDDRESLGTDRVVTSRYQIQGNLDKLLKEIKAGQVDMVCIALPFRAELRIRDFLLDCQDSTVSVYLAQDYETFDMLHGAWTMMGTVPVVGVLETPFYGVDGIAKRIEDIILGTVFTLICLFPMLCIAIAVKMTSKGPIIFKQRRYGLNGKEILVWKFRSMRVCEDGDDIKQATTDDDRFTPIGRFLRKTSLDELPQFINVLQGRMSIVGPRPHAVSHNEHYRSIVNSYMLRHKVKPGITGWAQVNGWRGETDTLDKMQKRIEYDLEYIKKWSVGMDLKIIFMTASSVLTHENAY